MESTPCPWCGEPLAEHDQESDGRRVVNGLGEVLLSAPDYWCDRAPEDVVVDFGGVLVLHRF